MVSYSRLYDKIINHYKSLPFNGPGEVHHIIPKSLGGGDENSNLVLLPLRAHYVCHLLLTKMYEGEERTKMIYAAWMMSNQSKRKITSIQYELMKLNFRKVHKVQASINMKRRVENGTHNWLDGTQSRKQNKERVKNGTHNLVINNPAPRRVHAAPIIFLTKKLLEPVIKN